MKYIKLLMLFLSGIIIGRSQNEGLSFAFVVVSTLISMSLLADLYGRKSQ